MGRSLLSSKCSPRAHRRDSTPRTRVAGTRALRQAATAGSGAAPPSSPHSAAWRPPPPSPAATLASEALAAMALAAGGPRAAAATATANAANAAAASDGRGAAPGAAMESKEGDEWVPCCERNPVPPFGVDSPVIQHLLGSWTSDPKKLKCGFSSLFCCCGDPWVGKKGGCWGLGGLEYIKRF